VSDVATRKFRELVRELWLARSRGGLNQDEEADRAEELDSWWEQMSADERATMEAELRSNDLKPRAVSGG